MSLGSSSVRIVGRFSGGLIQTSAAGVSFLGTHRTNRSGWRACERRPARRPVPRGLPWPGRCARRPASEARFQSGSAPRCASGRTRGRSRVRGKWLTKWSGKSGRYFSVLNWLSENGLSSLTWGLLWDNCGGDIRLIAFITEPGPIRKLLTHLGEPLEPPPVSPARGPPTDWGELVQVHDDRNVFQASPDELPAIDIHSL